jgi:peptidoglycan/xylan/chitin deacetylase (PgdA/CDA1 family)
VFTQSDAFQQFAIPRHAHSRFRPVGMSGKLSRLMARSIATKPATMGNTGPLVTFTFDDAPESACVTGARLLQKYRARGTFYISGRGCGLISPGGRLASVEQLQALHAAGHEIGCHTFSHAAVAGIGREALAAELERNRVFLRGIHSDIGVRNFAYPYGDLSFRTKYYLEARFDSCRSLRAGVNAGTADLGALRSCELQNASIGREGIADIMAETVRRNGWLIFVSHDVHDEPSRFGVTPDLLESALAAASAAKCQVVTVADALRRMHRAFVRQTREPLTRSYI